MSIKVFKNKGLTFIELLMVLAVVSVSIASSASGMVEFVLNNRATAQVNDIQSTLSLARLEAIKRNKSVTVCHSIDRSQCSGNWRDGWIVFLDTNTNGEVDDGEVVLRTHGEIEHGNRLSFPDKSLVYNKNGTARVGPENTFVLCDSRGVDSAIGVVVSPSGRPRLATDYEMNGIQVNEKTAGLACT